MSLIFNSCLIMLCGLLVIPSTGGAAATEEHLYIRKTGERTSFFNWRLEQNSGIRLITDLDQERDVTGFQENLATISWAVNDPSEHSEFKVIRHNNKLLFRGTFEGKELAREVDIGESPWYQALSLSLRQFANPNIDHLEFWSIRPDTLDIHEMQANRSGEEQIMIDGIPVDTIKLKIQLTGLKAAFWSCHYWLRKSDGLFIRYAGPSGPPGWPETTVELVKAPDALPSTEAEFSLRQ